MSSTPPNWISRILAKVCRPALWESIEGDLHELFESDLEEFGNRKAKINYVFNALAFLRYHRLRKHTKTQNNMVLFKNYLKVSVRDLKRNKTFASINLVGLVAGMTVSLLMLQYVLFETGFDRFNKDADRIYRVINDRFQNGELIQHGTITYPTIGPTMAKDFPEVESYTRMLPYFRNYAKRNNEQYLINNAIVVDEHFLTFFDYTPIKGDLPTGLDEVNELVITRSFGEKLLKKNEELVDLVGERIDLFKRPFSITAVLEDPPKNSHLQFDALISYKTYIESSGEDADKSWNWSDFYHYVKLKDGVKASDLDEKIADFGVRYFKKGEVSGGEEKFYLQPLLEAHLDNTMEYDFAVVTNGKIVWLMLATAIFIIFIAWINYINLNTGRAIQRAKEVGIRKSIGALKGQIVSQFFTETIFLNGIALFLSILMVFILQPYFNQLTGLDLSLMILLTAKVGSIPFLILLMASLLLSFAIISLYPAYLVTKFSTQDILKGSFKLNGEIVWLRKGLVIFQFCIAVILISASIIVSRQINYMVNQDLGFDMENTMVLYGPSQTRFDSAFFNTIDVFKQKVSRLSGVKKVTTSNRSFGSKMGRIFQIKSSSDPEAKNLTSNFMSTDHEFLNVFGIDVVEGRSLKASDHNLDGEKVKNIVINQAALDLLKFDQASEAVGRTIDFWGKTWTIVGVVKNFHQLSLHEKIEPIIMIPYYSTGHGFSVKMESEASEALISTIQGVYNETFPDNYFDYFFLEDRYNQQYTDDFRVGKISKVFTFLSILIAVLGLYGLVVMTLVKKTKEIGMRKVLGASLNQLLILLSKDFLPLVLIAITIGGPLSYFALTKWKSNFAYAPDVSIGLIVAASLVLILISVLTILFQTRKISRNNPVDSLRCE